MGSLFSSLAVARQCSIFDTSRVMGSYSRYSIILKTTLLFVLEAQGGRAATRRRLMAAFAQHERV